MANNTNLKIRLSILNFIEFAVWGSYLISMGIYLNSVGLAQDIFWFYTVQGLVSLFMPAIVGIVADKWIPAQKMLSLCHLIAAVFMLAAGWYGYSVGNDVQFGTLFTFYTLSVAFFMPTIGLSNSVAFNALSKNGLDTIKAFPPIRTLGTIGFICSELFVNFTGFQNTYAQFICSGVLSVLMAMYAVTMPKCDINPSGKSSLVDSLGLSAFKLFKTKKMAIFFIFSMLLGVSLQITNSYGTTFISTFRHIAEFTDTWGAENATALTALSQASEALCILLIPFCLRKFGIKGVMLIAMFAWVLRFGFFGIGNTGSGLIWLVLSCLVYGVAFDFFNVSGGLFVDKETDPKMRSSAQGLFMIMTNGIGASLGTFVAGKYIVNNFVPKYDPNIDIFSKELAQSVQNGWHESWLIFAAYAFVVTVLFFFIFKDDKKKISKADVIMNQSEDPGGMVIEEK